MLRVVLILVTVFAAIGAGTVGAVFAGYNAYKSQLPDASTITNMEPQIDTDVYDAAGDLIQVFHNDGLPPHPRRPRPPSRRYFKEAIVAVEDHNFYTEGSWDLARLVESGVADITHSASTVQGGSTITEQLAKISLYGGADPPQSIDYKIKEIVLGNEIAAELHEGPDPRDVHQQDLLRELRGRRRLRGRAVLPQARKPARPGAGVDARRTAAVTDRVQPADPSRPTTTVNPLAKNRQKQVLQAMVASGDVTQAQAAAAYAETADVPFVDASRTRTSTPTSSTYLEGYLNVHFPQYANPGGYVIHTTLDPAKQNLAYTTVHAEVAGTERREHERRRAGEPRPADR